MKKFLKTMMTVVGIVLVWRGIWYIMDQIDTLFFSGAHMWTAVAGTIIGLALLYFPDGDLKEIEKL